MSLKRLLNDFILKALIWLFALLTIGFLIWILTYIIIKGFAQLSLGFITTQYSLLHETYGIFPMIINTLWIILITLIIATPIGVFAAIYLVEYAKKGKLLNVIRFATESLAGIPSIIYGLFGYIFFVGVLKLGFSILAGSLTLGIMILPTIVRTTEEALKAVNPAYKEGSLALGATKLYTIFKVVLPSAIPGILTAIILSIGRVVGETAAVYFTAGTVAKMAKGMMSNVRTLAVHLYILAKEGLSDEQAYATACVLLIIVAFINFIANKIGKFYSKKRVGQG